MTSAVMSFAQKTRGYRGGSPTAVQA